MAARHRPLGRRVSAAAPAPARTLAPPPGIAVVVVVAAAGAVAVAVAVAVVVAGAGAVAGAAAVVPIVAVGVGAGAVTVVGTGQRGKPTWSRSRCSRLRYSRSGFCFLAAMYEPSPCVRENRNQETALRATVSDLRCLRVRVLCSLSFFLSLFDLFLSLSSRSLCISLSLYFSVRVSFVCLPYVSSTYLQSSSRPCVRAVAESSIMGRR